LSTAHRPRSRAALHRIRRLGLRGRPFRPTPRSPLERVEMAGLSLIRSWLRRPGRPPRRPRAALRPCTLTVEELESRRLPTTLATPLHMDLGSAQSPVAPGHLGVPLVAYNSAQGYGWASTSA